MIYHGRNPTVFSCKVCLVPKENGAHVRQLHVQQLGQVLDQVRLGQVRCTCMAFRLGVHVWQLGQVYMYDSQVRCQVRLGQVRIGQVRLGQDRLGQVRIGQVRLGQVRLGQVRKGQVVRSRTSTADKIIDHLNR